MRGMSAAYASGLVVSVSSVNNWQCGSIPTEETARRFFSQFAGEDVEEWAKLVRESQEMRVVH